MTFFQVGASKQNAFFQKRCPKKSHPWPQCLGNALFIPFKRRLIFQWNFFVYVTHAIIIYSTCKLLFINCHSGAWHFNTKIINSLPLFKCLSSLLTRIITVFRAETKLWTDAPSGQVLFYYISCIPIRSKYVIRKKFERNNFDFDLNRLGFCGTVLLSLFRII